MMKSIRSKLAIFFILIITVSSSSSFLASTLMKNSSIRSELRLSQQTLAISMIELHQKTDLSIDDIISIVSNFMYDIRKIEEIESIDLSALEIEKIQDREIIFLQEGKFPVPATMFKLDDVYIKITLHPNNNIFKVVSSRVGFTLISYILIGSMLFILSTKRLIKPILKLTTATQEVAKGNFDVQIKNNSHDEIGQLTNNFNKMTQELKRIEYLRKDFINNVSHEFKTPIASIQGFAKLLQSQDLSEEERTEYASIIIEETARLTKLSSNILKLSKLENQETSGVKTTFSLDEQIRRCILLLEHEWSRKNIEFDIELDAIPFTGDEELLQQVWINLISNAVKFSHENSVITVKLYQIGSLIKVKIIDKGIGMSSETQERIFEKFYQGERSHLSDGNGLGLSIVKRIIDICGGDIIVKSSLGEGTTTTIILRNEHNAPISG